MRGPTLIVNADDFGISERVNAGILAGHHHGIVTSTSLIASGTAFDHAVQLAQTNPTLDIGVHLTLTEERPILKCEQIPTLLNKSGLFHLGAGEFMKRYLTHRISLDEVRREFEAQVSKVVTRGVAISHLDGHQHLHMLRGIRQIVAELSRKYGVPAIRFPRERPRAYMLFDHGNFHRLLEMLVLNSICRLSNTAGAKQPEHFFGFFFGGRLTRNNLMKVLEQLPDDGICELMCHPGFDDPGSQRARWGYRWQEELDALTDDGIQRYLKTRGVQLISYAAFTAS